MVHHAVLVEEILRCIFRHLPNRSLVAAAVTCRAWSDAAMDILWESVDLIKIFSALFPPGRDRQYPKYTPIPSVRFRSLVNRVKEGRLSHGSVYLTSMLSGAQRNSIPIPLFPNIHAIEFTIFLRVGFPHLAQLIGPNLQTLVLSCEATPTPNFFTDLPTIIPNLVTLTITVVHYNHAYVTVQGLMETVGRLQALQRLKLLITSYKDDISPLLVALAVHPSLQSLHIVGDYNCRWSSATRIEDAFHGLRELILPDGEDRHAPLLEFIGHPSQIRIIDLGSNACGVVDPWETLCALGSHTLLETLLFTGTESPRPLPSDVLRPIQACSSLRILSITVQQPILVTDADIGSLASHLPQLRHLTFVAPHNFRPILTLLAYAGIATSCPNIESINLEVDASRGAEYAIAHPCRYLGFVHVRQSYIQEAESVALFFSQLSSMEGFKIKHYYFDESMQIKYWEDVKYILPFLRP
ncbi:hypothetical protein FRB97_000218 [Tulasnella sp. 331]|nr:hypothetical protein FRB98_004055 [Tulasnella sp. 332]KAG8870208.1 hypothetical protein FRB97_000218 [Tulasnella sp. 331]